jgi:hypothetical protein
MVWYRGASAVGRDCVPRARMSMKAAFLMAIIGASCTPGRAAPSIVTADVPQHVVPSAYSRLLGALWLSDADLAIVVPDSELTEAIVLLTGAPAP